MARRSTLRSGTAKSLVYAVLCMVLGAFLILGGAVTWKNPADCGGQTMQQGDTCEVTDNGSTTDRSLSDQESSNHREALIMFVLGPLMIIGGGFWLSSEVRIRQRRRAAALGTVPAAGAMPFPPPYNPAQAQNPYAAPAQQQYAPPPQQQQGWPGQQPQQVPPYPQQYPGQHPQQYQSQYPQQYQQPQQPPQPPQPPQGGWPGN
jgi:hypothetical protein